MRTLTNGQLPDRVIVTITGRTETYRRPTGLEGIWRGWIAQDIPRGVWITDPKQWCWNMEAFAEFIHRNTTLNARILIVAYSWGVGVGAIELIEALAKHDRSVWGLCSCDGVSRSRLFPKWFHLNPASLWSKIRLPRTLRQFWGVYQREDFPRGYRPIFGPETLMHAWHQINKPHGTIDEDELWRIMVGGAVKGLVDSLGIEKL